MDNAYWITESITYAVYAESEEQARKEWAKYMATGETSDLNIKMKGCDIEADWRWEA